MLTLTLDFAGTVADAENTAAEFANSYDGLSYEVIEPGTMSNQWPTILAYSLDQGELLAFASQVYKEPAEDLAYLISC